MVLQWYKSCNLDSLILIWLPSVGFIHMCNSCYHYCATLWRGSGWYITKKATVCFVTSVIN